MDFGIDTIVYIILGLVFFVAQAGKKKKAKALRVSTDIEENSDSDVGSRPGLLEELFSQNENGGFVHNSVEKEPFLQEKTTPLFSDSASVEETLLDDLKKRKIEDLPKENIEKTIDDSKKGSTQISEFDLRNAVVYSAILERKYF